MNPIMYVGIGRNDKIDIIISNVCQYYGITVDEIKSHNRHRKFSIPRQVSMYLLNTMLHNTTRQEIGNQFNNRDHSTVTHDIREDNNQISINHEFKQEIENLRENIF